MWLLKCLPVVRPGCFLNTLRTGRNIGVKCPLIFNKGEALLISHGEFLLSLGSKYCKKTPHIFSKMSEDCYGLSTRKGSVIHHICSLKLPDLSNQLRTEETMPKAIWAWCFAISSESLKMRCFWKAPWDLTNNAIVISSITEVPQEDYY